MTDSNLVCCSKWNPRPSLGAAAWMSCWDHRLILFLMKNQRWTDTARVVVTAAVYTAITSADWAHVVIAVCIQVSACVVAGVLGCNVGCLSVQDLVETIIWAAYALVCSVQAQAKCIPEAYSQFFIAKWCLSPLCSLVNSCFALLTASLTWIVLSPGRLSALGSVEYSSRSSSRRLHQAKVANHIAAVELICPLQCSLTSIRF